MRRAAIASSPRHSGSEDKSILGCFFRVFYYFFFFFFRRVWVFSMPRGEREVVASTPAKEKSGGRERIRHKTTHLGVRVVLMEGGGLWKEQFWAKKNLHATRKTRNISGVGTGELCPEGNERTMAPGAGDDPEAAMAPEAVWGVGGGRDHHHRRGRVEMRISGHFHIV